MKKTEKLFILRGIVENVHYTILLHVNGIKRCMIRQSRNANFRAQSATQLVSIYLQYRVVDFFFNKYENLNQELPRKKNSALLV